MYGCNEVCIKQTCSKQDLKLDNSYQARVQPDSGRLTCLYSYIQMGVSFKNEKVNFLTLVYIISLLFPGYWKLTQLFWLKFVNFDHDDCINKRNGWKSAPQTLVTVKFVWGLYWNGNCYQEKKKTHFSFFILGKILEKWLCSPWKLFLLHPCLGAVLSIPTVYLCLCTNNTFALCKFAYTLWLHVFDLKLFHNIVQQYNGIASLICSRPKQFVLSLLWHNWASTAETNK